MQSNQTWSCTQLLSLPDSEIMTKTILLNCLALTLSMVLLPSLQFAQNKKRKDPLAIPEVSRDKVICFALYTVHAKTLKLTAQLYP